MRERWRALCNEISGRLWGRKLAKQTVCCTLCQQSYSPKISNTASVITADCTVRTGRRASGWLQIGSGRCTTPSTNTHTWVNGYTPQSYRQEGANTHKWGWLHPPLIPSYLLSMQCFPRTEEKNLFYLHVIASELVGGIRESTKRGRRQSERCRKGTDSSRFENSLNGAAPK